MLYSLLASVCGLGTRAGHVRTTFPFSDVASVIPNRSTAEMAPTFLEKGRREEYEALVSKYDTWLFDCDGVLWNGDRLVEGAKEVLEMLRRRGGGHRRSYLDMHGDVLSERRADLSCA